jgi:hypothetical protein
MIANLRNFLRTMPKITLLENTHIDLEGDIRVYGTTLWSHIPEEARGLVIPMLTFDGRPADASWLNREHAMCVCHLETAIQTAQIESKRLVVVSHYAPTFVNTVDESYDALKKFYYASNLTRLLNQQSVHTWVFGHTHVNCDYVTTDGTHVVSNQLMGSNFEQDKVIRVPHVEHQVIQPLQSWGC